MTTYVSVAGTFSLPGAYASYFIPVRERGHKHRIPSSRPDSNAERKEGRRETWFHLVVRSFTILVRMMFGSEFLTRSLARARLPALGVYAPCPVTCPRAVQACIGGRRTRIYIYQNTGMQGHG